jgi:hypothetical protein
MFDPWGWCRCWCSQQPYHTAGVMVLQKIDKKCEDSPQPTTATATHHRVLCCTVLYCAVLCCTVLYCAVLCCTVLYCTVLYCAVLCCTVLYCAVLHCTVHTVSMATVRCQMHLSMRTASHHAVLNCTVLHFTRLY